MRKYRVFVRGENFLMGVDGVKQKFGFYTTRFVEAPGEEEAEEAAIDLLRKDPQLVRGVLNERDDSPVMYVEEIEELESFKYPVPGSGFTPSPK